jgi:hypothetical protein
VARRREGRLATRREPTGIGDSGARKSRTAAEIISIVLAVVIIAAMLGLYFMLRYVRYTGTEPFRASPSVAVSSTPFQSKTRRGLLARPSFSMSNLSLFGERLQLLDRCGGVRG